MCDINNVELTNAMQIKQKDRISHNLLPKTKIVLCSHEANIVIDE
jgi:hypothetical protein